MKKSSRDYKKEFYQVLDSRSGSGMTDRKKKDFVRFWIPDRGRE
jgi:hypothetical protein